MIDKVPRVPDLLNPTLKALRDLGGSATIQELVDQVIENLDLPDKVLSQLHTGSTKKTELEYRLDWARTRLKFVGLIENSKRGVWSLTPKGRATTAVDPRDVMKSIRPGKGSKRAATSAGQEEKEDEEPTDAWRDKVLTILQGIPPAAFERLCRRVLLESGVTNVEVTGGSRDQGLDGQGQVKLNGLISFPVYFQCKRYQGTVGSKVVRDFRGALEGRSQHGLLMTTGRFSSDARKEAARPGAKSIDLMDGYEFAEKLRELDLGIKTKTESVEAVEVDALWFQTV